MQTRAEQLHQTRRSKVTALRQAGVDPFGSRFPGRPPAGWGSGSTGW